MAPQSAIRSKQMEKTINGIPTQVVCTEFSNYIFIVLTQYGKIGTLLSVTPDTRSGDISVPMFTTRVLLGKDEVCSEVLFFFFFWIVSMADKIMFVFHLGFFVSFAASYTRLRQECHNICLTGIRQPTGPVGPFT